MTKSGTILTRRSYAHPMIRAVGVRKDYALWI